jgi:hypothetical protein
MPNLKQTLLLDAMSALVFVVLCLGCSQSLAQLTGLPVAVIAVAGWICVPSALLFIHQALAPSRPLVTAVVAGNAAWVLASIAVWIACWTQLTPLGHGLVIAQALAVELFTVLEWRGLKALPAAPAAA